MTKLNLDQRKVIADLLINIITGIISIVIITQIFVQRNFSQFSLIFGSAASIISIALTFIAVDIVKQK